MKIDPWAEFWDRLDDLKVSLTEGDVGWIPYFLWRAEHVQDRHSGWTQRVFAPGESPITVFNRHLIACFIDDPIAIELIDHLNVDQRCWESEFPHSDGTWPNAPERLAARLAALPDDVAHKISHENAIRLFSFHPFAIRAKERCTAQSLRAESPDVDTLTRVGRAASARDLELCLQIGARVASQARS